MTKILAAAWHPGGANSLVPVIKQLQVDNDVSIVARGGAEVVFTRNGLPYNTCLDYGASEISLSNMHDIVWEEKPDLVLTGTSCQDKDNYGVLEQQIVLASRIQDHPTLSVLGMWERDYGKLFSDGNTTGGKHRFLPDKVAVLDDIMKDAMTQEGFSPDQLVVTGNPYFDNLAPLRNSFNYNDRERVRKELGLPPGDPLIMFASQPIEHHYGDTLGYTEKTALRDLLQGVVEAHVQGPQFNVLVKAHPREDKVELEAVAREFSAPVVVDQTYDTRQAILASEVVVSMFSTVLVESTYLDRISVSLQPGMAEDNDQLVTNALGVTHAIYQPGKIGGFLKTVSSHVPYVISLADARKKFRPDGNATRRVVELAYSMIK